MKTLGQMFTDPTHHKYQAWQRVVTIFILASCVGLALETVPEFNAKYGDILQTVEWISVVIFTIDYIANLLYSEEKLKYAFSLWGIIDLISILPSYLMLLNLTALQGTNILRLLRVARVLRVLKLVRGAVDNQSSGNPIVSNLKIYLIILFSVMMISSTAMFFVEGGLYSAENIEIGQKALDALAQPGQTPEQYVPRDPISGNPVPADKQFFTSIPAALWWCTVTLTSTGYGDMYPVTVGGRIIGGLTMFLGLVLFGILLNIVGKTLMVVLFGEKLKADD
jgi:voltage-gated potassium channel